MEGNDKMQVNNKLLEIPEIFTKKLTEALKESPDVVNLARGDSEFATPKSVVEYLSNIILDDGDYAVNINTPVGKWTHYEKESGSTHLKTAIANKYYSESGLKIKSNNILITQGGMNAIFYAFYSCLLPGDEIIVFDPAYIAYESIGNYIMHNIIVKRFSLVQHENYDIDYDKLKKHLSPKTKAIILTSPYNPCGRVYKKEQLLELMNFCKANDIIVIHDENHEKEVYGTNVHYPISIFDETLSSSILLNSFSRLGMGGWRIGWMVACDPIIKAASRLHAFVNMTCNTFVQEAAAFTLDNYSTLGFEEKFLNYENKRNKLVSFFKNIKGIICTVPEGTCYLFPLIDDFYNEHKNLMLDSVFQSKWFNDLSNDRKQYEKDMINTWKSYLVYLFFLLEIKVGILPGCCYGNNSDNNIRVSFSVRDEAIDEAIKRMKKLELM